MHFCKRTHRRGLGLQGIVISSPTSRRNCAARTWAGSPGLNHSSRRVPRAARERANSRCFPQSHLLGGPLCRSSFILWGALAGTELRAYTGCEMSDMSQGIPPPLPLCRDGSARWASLWSSRSSAQSSPEAPRGAGRGAAGVALPLTRDVLLHLSSFMQPTRNSSRASVDWVSHCPALC